MRVRWLIVVFALGMLIAYIEHNLIAAYITIFGTMILISLRRIQGEIGHFKGPVNLIGSEAQMALQLVTEIYRTVTPKIQLSKMFAGDRHDGKER